MGNLIKDYTKCFVCDKNDNNLINIEHTKADYSGKLLVDIFVNTFGCATDLILPGNGSVAKLCTICLVKVNKYDYAHETAEQVRIELTDLLSISDIKAEVMSGKLPVINEEQSQFSNIAFLKSEKKSNKDDFNNLYVKSEYDHEDEFAMSSINYTTDTISTVLPSKPRRTLKNKPKQIIRLRQKRKNPKNSIQENDDLIEDPRKREAKLCKKPMTKIYKCTYDGCQMVFQTKKEYLIHRKQFGHKGHIECEICGKKYKERSGLLRHRAIHTGEKNYQCEVCGKRFSLHSSIQSHRSVHTGQRSKKCNICGLQLRNTSHLNVHLRTHTGEKPFECPTCGKKFSRGDNMRVHIKIHQGIIPVPVKTCPICSKTFPRIGKLKQHLANDHAITSPFDKT